MLDRSAGGPCPTGLEIWAKRLDRLAPLTLTIKKGDRIIAHHGGKIFDRLRFET